VALAKLGARRVVYVSCDPATLARDLGVLLASGYRLASCRGFDLFPQTPHLEALAVLERSAPG
jgi:23S rRNA (uracil1939-C5)-methyltransferase